MINRRILLLLALTVVLLLSACAAPFPPARQQAPAALETAEVPSAAAASAGGDSSAGNGSGEIPEFDGENPYVVVNGNEPFFSPGELTSESYETYSGLDPLGRCGPAEASVGRDLMPTQERGSIREVRPSGWRQATYDFVDGGALYNRCHLIGWQLTAEDANAGNLITGTRYLNVQGMLPFENLVADYVKETGNHVLYRVTPIFAGDELVARGVLMEAESVEDEGEGVQFCIYAFNVQPGVEIDYQTGESWLARADSGSEEPQLYILNTNTGKFHLPSCASAVDMNPANREEVRAPRSSLLQDEYRPCGACQP
ncbi:MAG: hypothetical protein HDQ87_07030 [Clostridia bacterium]|nr:hypothetical protein [Clostridia bacterium]